MPVPPATWAENVTTAPRPANAWFTETVTEGTGFTRTVVDDFDSFPAASVIVQVAAFRLTGRRVFRMAPIHHHFELAGWPEFTVIVRFWILAGLAVAFGLGLFYADFLARGGTV